ncbi:MAG: hypothetical protein ACP5KS_10425, partial [Candidatus Hydrogenedens sp.]
MSKGMKVFLGLVFVLTLIVILNSCGGQKSEPSTPAPAQQAGKTATDTEKVEKPSTPPPAEKALAQPAEQKAVPSATAGGKPK